MKSPQEVAQEYDRRLDELTRQRDELRQEMERISNKRLIRTETKQKQLWALENKRSEILREMERVEQGKRVRVSEAQERQERSRASAETPSDVYESERVTRTDEHTTRANELTEEHQRKPR